MPTLIVENVPAEVYERLKRRAATRHRSIPEETLDLLHQALGQDKSAAPRLPEFVPGEELSAPADLPRSSQPVPVRTYSGPPRLPDGIPE